MPIWNGDGGWDFSGVLLFEFCIKDPEKDPKNKTKEDATKLIVFYRH